MGRVPDIVRRARRAFLADTVAFGAALFGARSAWAGAGPSDLRIGQLELAGAEWNPRPTALRRLLWEVGQRTSIEVHLEPVSVSPEDPGIFRHPLLYWAGSGAAPTWSDAAIRNVRRHLSFGGILLIDDADADPGGAFERSARREVERILPRDALAPIPNDHVIYKSFYLVPHQAGRRIAMPHLLGASLEDRYAVIYSGNDLGGAWARDAFGRWEYEVAPGGERQREMAFRVGVNLAMYALCLDYKDDLVHTPFILRRRR
jgi:hypothetical protein